MKRTEAGDSDAQIGLGLLYMEGKGVPKDKEKAVEWYNQSAINENYVWAMLR